MKSRLHAGLIVALLLTALVVSVVSGQGKRKLDIYYVDVEGGAATLIVTPAGESVLVDAGWPGREGRDAKRIQKAMQQAGISAIDHLIMTHYHVDHFGGIADLAKQVTIHRFYDRGVLGTDIREYKDNPAMYQGYLAAAGNKNITLKPGDEIKLKSAPGTPAVKLLVLAASTNVISGKKGAVNAECATATAQPEDTSDNARSVTFKLSYGNFDFFDAGDLTWNIEQKLACPANLVGEVDLYQVTHHGMNTSNNPALVRALKPTVAIMNNGPRKGGHPDTYKTLRAQASIRDVWQLHRNVTTTAEQNTTPDYIANMEEAGDEAHMVTVSVDAAKRNFTLTNQRNQKSQTYATR
ncbi:MAG: ComEC/Rec2 family competence protein [Blastocatellia bacterium]